MKRAETLSFESIHRLQPCAMINNLTGETDGRAITARTTRANETSETYCMLPEIQQQTYNITRSFATAKMLTIMASLLREAGP
jgi:hypothetical protein